VVSRLDGAAPGEGEERFALDRPRQPRAGVRTGGDSMATTWQGY
jgi:hypothetical protein